MTSQTSKKALGILDKTEFAIMSTLTQNGTVSAVLVATLPAELPTPEGELIPMPDWQALQTYHAALLEQSADTARQADQTHRIHLVNVAQRRIERRQLVNAIETRHRDLRQSFRGTYGPDSLPLVGLDSPPAAAYLALREQQLEVAERMQDPKLAGMLPDPRAGQVALQPADLAKTVASGVEAFEQISDEIVRLRKVLDESLLAKRETLGKHRRLYINIVRIQESYYRLAGLDELADRIRAGERKPRTAKDTAEPDDPTETESPESTDPADGDPSPAPATP